MIDVNGLYVEENGDGGDCPHRTGIMIMYFAVHNLVDSLRVASNVFTYLRVMTNSYIRYPVIYNAPKDFSRDQASRLMLGLGATGYLQAVKGYYNIVYSNKLRHPNDDLLGLEEIINLIRLFSLWYLYPLLILLDMKYFVDVIVRKYNPWGYDALFLPDLYYAVKVKYWTPTAWLASKIYKLSDAEVQITANLLDPNTNGCKEAGNALISLFRGL